MVKRCNTLMPVLAILASILACAAPPRAPEYVLRHWTPTPPPASITPPPVSRSTPAPTIIYVYPTTGWYQATVRTDHLEIRNGPGTKYPANPDLYLRLGDQITIMACKYDDTGEAWANFSWPKKNLFGWAAVTYRGQIFLWPMPERCSR